MSGGRRGSCAETSPVASRFETARLRLRPPVPADATDIYAHYACDAGVTRFLSWPPVTDVSETVRFLERCRSGWESSTVFSWVLVRKRDARLLGMVELRRRGRSAELGYVLERSAWGQGYMTEALGSVLCWARAHPRIRRLSAICHVENCASRRVLEKIGLRPTRPLRRWDVHADLSVDRHACYRYTLTF